MRLSHTLSWLESLAGTRRGALALFVVALLVFAVQSIAIPVAGGRDFGSYLAYYVQMWDSRPASLTPLVARTPIAPLAIGVPLDIGGVATVVWMALLYAGSVIAWCWVALSFGRRAALVTAALLLLYPGYGILFHGLSSDPIFAAAFAGWAVLLTRATLRPSWGRFLLVGLGIAFLAGIRPGNQVLALFVVFPLLLAGQWRSRLTWVAALLAGIVIPLGALAVNNGVRYGNYGVAGGASTFGLFRMFVTDRIIQPENGPVSREFARGVKRYLLPEEPYRSYGITSDEFFSSGSLRMQADVGWVASRLWDDAGEGKLRALMWEAIRSHPRAYASGVSQSMWDLLWRIRLWVPVASSGDRSDSGSGADTGGVVSVGGSKLPRPTEGEPIPAPHGGQVWISPTEHHPILSPAGLAASEALLREVGRLEQRVPVHDNSPGLAHRLNQASRWYPAPLVWLVLGLLGIAFRRPRRMLLALALPAAALLVLLLTSLGFFAVAEYVVPVVPAFILVAAAGLAGERKPDGQGELGTAALTP
jgi:hypothetical protein